MYVSIGTAEFKHFQDFLGWLMSDDGKNWKRNQWSEQTNQYCANDWDEEHIGLYNYQKMIPDLHKALDIYDQSYRGNLLIQQNIWTGTGSSSRLCIQTRGSP